MDSSSHVLMGASTGLMISAVATNMGYEVNTAAIVTTSIVANVFPDIDVVFKLKNNNAYINAHRGASHSLMFAVLWISIISAVSYAFNPDYFMLYFGVAALGLSLHIFTDLLNGYGVQFLWPFHKKWIAFGVTYTFDVIFSITHIIGLTLVLLFHLDVLVIFSIVYIILAIYVFISFLYHYQLKKDLIKKYGRYKRLILQAKATPVNWKYVYETNDKKFYMGTIHYKEINQLRYERRYETLDPDLEKILYKDKNVRAFIDFTPIFNYHIRTRNDGTIEIKYYDLRYLIVRKNQYSYTFNCFVQVKDNVVLTSYLGFTINEEAAHRKFKKISNQLQT